MKDLTYNGEVDINYILKKPSSPSDVLVVAFPGGGHDFAASQLGYTYMMTIGKFNVNALYLRSKPEYKLSRLTCINRDFKIERTIKNLIDECKEDTGSSRVIAIGSSMGGFCAIYYGLKYDYEIISGTPPVTFTSSDSYTYAAGSSTKADRDWLESQISLIIAGAGKRKYNEKFFVMWGKGEENWLKVDMAPRLIKELDLSGIKYTYKLFDFKDHTTISRLFPNILENRLSISLGLKDSADTNDDITQEASATQYLKTAYTDILSLIGTIKRNNINAKITNCVYCGDTSFNNALRNYVYAMQSYFWFTGCKEPFTGKNKNDFWHVIPSNKVAEGISFRFQHTMLKFYKKTDRDDALEWVIENIRQFIFYVQPTATETKHYNQWRNAMNRLFFFIDFCAVISEKMIKIEYFDEIISEILRDVRLFASYEVMITNALEQYQRVLCLLHTALFFRESVEFFDNTSKKALEIANKITDYYFDENGVCVFMQVNHQHIYGKKVEEILNFIDKNNLPDSKALRRKFKSISRVAQHLVTPDGIIPALGHTPYSRLQGVEPAKGNMIIPSSNIAVLNDGMAYITVNGGSNIRSAWKHCDLLSFTLWYKGHQIIRDSGGGGSELDDFARSATAHTSFICDDIDYITPDYIDWTTINRVDEQDDYVLIDMSHSLIDGVELSRKLIWLKPNIIILVDKAKSEEVHKYSQNFIFANYSVNTKDKSKVNLRVTDDLTITINQVECDDNEFELMKYTGTANIKDVDHFRGSLISADFKKLRKGLNLAYCKQDKTSEFLTYIEVCSGSDKENSVASMVIQNDVLDIKLDNETNMKVNLRSI